MSSDERVKKLDERIAVTLVYTHTDKLDKKRTSIPNTTKLKKLAKEIRKNLEEYPLETPAHSHS